MSAKDHVSVIFIRLNRNVSEAVDGIQYSRCWYQCFPKLFLVVCCKLRDEWTEAIQMVADKLQRQEEERIQCSPTSNIDNMVEEEMDISTTHHKRKVTHNNRRAHRHTNTYSLSHAPYSKHRNYSSCSLSCTVMGYFIWLLAILKMVCSVTGLCQHEIASVSESKSKRFSQIEVKSVMQTHYTPHTIKVLQGFEMSVTQ